MPTETDIRAALEEFAALAGDTCTSFDPAHYGCQPGGAHTVEADIRPTPATAPPQRHGVAIGVSAAAVAAAIAVSLVVVQGGTGHHHGAPPAADGSQTTSAPPLSTSPTSRSVAPVPADALRWTFTVDPIPGYTFAYSDDQPDPHSGQQNASLTSTTNPDVSARITVYPRGGFDPTHGSVDGTAVRGQTVTVNGNPGTFVSGPSTPTLFWTYANDSWASIGVSGTAAANALPFALRVARAVRTDTSALIKLPFQVGTLPKPLKLVDVAPLMGQGVNTQSTVIYGTSFNAAQGIYLTVTRMSPARATTLRPLVGGRAISRYLPDGSTLRVAVEPNHVNDISQSQLEAILNEIDTAPTLADPSTWLPVVPSSSVEPAPTTITPVRSTPIVRTQPTLTTPAPVLTLACKVEGFGPNPLEFEVDGYGTAAGYQGKAQVTFSLAGTSDQFPPTTVQVYPMGSMANWHLVPQDDIGAGTSPTSCSARVE